MRMPITIALLTALSFSLAQAADDSDPDPGFGVDGLALGGIDDNNGGITACRPLVQGDGKILMCGTRQSNPTSGADFFVVRYTADGQPDPDFSFDGSVTIDFTGVDGVDTAKAIALQADGRIVVVGTARTDAFSRSEDFAIARLEPDGTLDATFGAGSGKKIIPFDLDNGTGSDDVADVAVQADGRIVIAGTVKTAANGRDFGVLRLLGDGTPDPAFNLTGKVTVGFDLAAGSSHDDVAYRVLIDPAQRILVAGSANNGADALATDFAVARLLANGQRDANFSADGRTTIAFDLGTTGSDIAYGLALSDDAKILLCGNVDVSPSAVANIDIGVARLLGDGSPDAGFGLSGKTLVTFDLTANAADFGLGIVALPGGRAVVVGAAQYDPTHLRAAAARLRGDGSGDPDFGAFGKRTYSFQQTTPDTQAFLGVTRAGSDLLIGGVIQVQGAGGNPYDSLVVRLRSDRVFADGFD